MNDSQVQQTHPLHPPSRDPHLQEHGEEGEVLAFQCHSETPRMQQSHPDPVAPSEQAKENVSAQPSDDPHDRTLAPALAPVLDSDPDSDLDLATPGRTFVEGMICPDPS